MRVYLGVAPGVGKTSAMLAEARRLAQAGEDVVVGVAETHGRADVERLREGLEQVAAREMEYRGARFDELDVDGLLDRSPAAAVVDELAHSCVPGGRHAKRWEDVEELLDAGIDVITSLNVQHLESLSDAVEALSGVPQRETVPDVVVAGADRVEFVDIAPERLRARLTEAGVVAEGREEAALGGFFTADRLAALRELALGWLDERDLLDASSRAVSAHPRTAAAHPEKVVAALTGAPEGEHVLRRASQIAAATGAELIGVYVRSPSGLIEGEPTWLAGQRTLLNELGGRFVELAEIDVATAAVDFAKAEGARQLELGATRRSRRTELLRGSVINKAIRAAGPIETHVIPARRPPRRAEPSRMGRHRRRDGCSFPPPGGGRHGWRRWRPRRRSRWR